MNKLDVIKELAPKLNVNQDDARVILNSVLEVLGNSLTELDEDERLKLVGFANFQKIRRKGRLGRNPKTGEEVKIPEKLIIKTTISENLVDSFNE